MKNYKFKINGTEYSVDINNVEDDIITLDVNGTPYKVTYEREKKQATAVVHTKTAPRVAAAAAGNVQKSTPAAPAGEKITAPLPGTILDVKVNVGDKVSEGQCLLVLEAMKMENSIEATVSGTVKSVDVRAGDAVLEGASLVVIG